jgi:hypothetical protein
MSSRANPSFLYDGLNAVIDLCFRTDTSQRAFDLYIFYDYCLPATGRLAPTDRDLVVVVPNLSMLLAVAVGCNSRVALSGIAPKFREPGLIDGTKLCKIWTDTSTTIRKN